MASKRTRDPDELNKRKLARKRFRLLIHKVYWNRLWLMDFDEKKLSLNVKKNIAVLVRQQGKSGLLTLAEKALINTHPSIRSISDRKKLVSLLNGLSCFASIPPKVRARLVPVVKFMYIGPNRMIIREGDVGSTVYFILAGEIEATKYTYDHLKKRYVDKIEFVCGPGDCIGAIEMIENIPRKNTYMSTSIVEMLVFYEESFNAILRPIMAQQWLDKKEALKTLGYFDYFTEDQLIYAARLGEIREFEPLETIYFEDKGPLSYVHFVVSGECMILQCLKMRVWYKNGKKMFELAEVAKPSNDQVTTLTFKEIIKMLKRPTKTELTNDLFEAVEERRSKSHKSLSLKIMDTKSIEISCGLRKSESFTSIHSSDLDISDFEEYSHYGTEHSFDMDDVYRTDSESYLKRSLGEERRSGRSKHYSQLLLPDVESTKTISSDGSLVNIFEKQEEDKEKDGIFSSEEKGYENHFIDVGSISFGGIFGLGEELLHRVIMARTTVQCFTLPRFWLLEKEQNPGNIWHRKKFYLDSTIPSREKLFQNFLTTRKWQKFKNDLIQSQLDPNSRSNPTKLQDIPIVIHILEEDED